MQDSAASRIKQAFAGLKRRRGFLFKSQSFAFAREVETILDDLKHIPDPETGFDLVCRFFEMDATLFEYCDDSYGAVGDLFRFTAHDYFVQFAKQIEDEALLAGRLQDLLAKDDYGIRDVLVHAASEFLGSETLRALLEKYEQRAIDETDTFQRRHYYGFAESLARQLHDAPSFERLRLAPWDGVSYKSCVDIAKVYLENGDPQRALEWLGRLSDGHHYTSERDDMLLEIYRQLGDDDALEKLARRMFSLYRSEKNLERLLEIVGRGSRDEIIANEIEKILGEEELSYPSAMFLLRSNFIDEAEKYLLDRGDQLNGALYSSILDLIDALSIHNRPLCTSILLRVLLDDILESARYKAYGHAAKYFKTLTRLAPAISDWRHFPSHSEYESTVRAQHGRKSSFWRRVNM